MLGLPRAPAGPGLPEDRAWEPLHDGADAVPRSMGNEMRRRSRRIRRVRSVEVEVHTAPEGAPEGWVEQVTAARLDALEDGRPRVLLLVARDPDRVEVRANQGLEVVFDARWREGLAEVVAPALHRRRVDLAARRAQDRAIRALERHLDGEPRAGWGPRIRRPWPRRRGGRTDEAWNRLSLQTFGGLALLGTVVLLGTRPGRRALRGWSAPPGRGDRGWFRGAGDSGGFGGGARGGRRPRPGW